MMVKKENGDGKSKPPAKPTPESELTERSLVVQGKQTSVRLEDALWSEVRAMAEERNVSVSDLVNSIDIKPEGIDLSSAIRRFITDYHRKRR